ncbi:MAG: protein kinase [Candidatus Latescibacterota bacterium]|nr:MAG: protein kinase [Candidatus Latescibacterota bacterium]
MIGRIVSHYKILERLGEGGMGVVYKARDLKLDRFVAMKFLPSQQDTDEDAKRRFIHEAKSASSLDHPNICAIHEIDETPEGQTFIVMPHYEGEPLDKKLENGPFGIEDAIDIVRQVASGLAVAHDKGIVHRDVKPGNVFVTDDGQVKLLDFGLAKLAGTTKFTKTGTTLGTVSYMSPEQARGEEVDVRSDVFSLGLVLYELLAGRPPFGGDHEAAILYGIVHKDPEPLSTSRSDIPEALGQIVDKALQKDVEKRHQNAADLVNDLEILLATLDTGEPVRRLKTARARRFRTEVGRRGVVVIAGVAAVALIGVSLLLWRHLAPSSDEGLALAVMDFRDLASVEDPTVSAGMTGLVNVGLVESSPVRVVSPEYLYDLRRRLFGDEQGPINQNQALEVARQAGATMLLSGQISRARGSPYVTWRLVDTRTGRNFAARRVDGDDIVFLADQIIAEVIPLLASESGVEVTSPPWSVTALTTSSPEAHRHYVAGVRAFGENRLLEAALELELAVRLDSTFALAFFELSRVQYSLKSDASEVEIPRDYADKAWELRMRLGIKDRLRLEAWRHQLDYRLEGAMGTFKELLARWPDDRRGLTDLSEILYQFWDFDEAKKIAKQGFELYPDDLFFGITYGTCLGITGPADEAIAVARSYIDQHPNNPNAWDELALRYLEAGLPDSAESAFRKALEIDPDFLSSQQGLGYCAYSRGDVEGAIDIFEQILIERDLGVGERLPILVNSAFWPGLSLLHAEAGRFEKALDLFEEARQDLSGLESVTRLESQRNLFLLRMGRADDVLEWARQLESRDDSRYARMMAARYRARSLAALDSVEAARVAVVELRAMEDRGGGLVRFLTLKITAEIELASNDPQSALRALEEIKQRGVFYGGLYDIEFREARAMAYRMDGQLEEAARVNQDLLRIYGAHALSHYELGKIYDEMGRPADAVQEYTTFLEMWSDADENLWQLADARRRLTSLKTDS